MGGPIEVDESPLSGDERQAALWVHGPRAHGGQAAEGLLGRAPRNGHDHPHAGRAVPSRAGGGHVARARPPPALRHIPGGDVETLRRAVACWRLNGQESWRLSVYLITARRWIAVQAVGETTYVIRGRRGRAALGGMTSFPSKSMSYTS